MNLKNLPNVYKPKSLIPKKYMIAYEDNSGNYTMRKGLVENIFILLDFVPGEIDKVVYIVEVHGASDSVLDIYVWNRVLMQWERCVI